MGSQGGAGGGERDAGGDDDLEERRRRGRELQERLPKPRVPRDRRSRWWEAESLHAGCCLAEAAAEATLLIGAVVGVAVAARSLQRRRAS